MVIILIAAVIILYFIISNFGSSTADPQSMDAATRSAGATEETAKPLGEILPLICPYERLDEDIKWNLEQNPDAKFDDVIGNHVTLKTDKEDDDDAIIPEESDTKPEIKKYTANDIEF